MKNSHKRLDFRFSKMVLPSVKIALIPKTFIFNFKNVINILYAKTSSHKNTKYDEFV